MQVQILDNATFYSGICLQGVVEIAMNMYWECGANDVLGMWGWLIAYTDGNCADLVDGRDYVTTLDSKYD